MSYRNKPIVYQEVGGQRREVEADFVVQNNDYGHALAHMRQARARQLRVWGMAPGAIDDQLKHEEVQLLARAAA